MAQPEPTDSTVCDTLISTLPWPQNLQSRLDTLTAERLFNRTQLGLMVYDLTADSVLYVHGASQQLRPASTMKLVTSITALSLLGGDYQFRTQLFLQGRMEGRTMLGNLICVGGMDPLFDDNDLSAFVESIRRSEIDTVCGRLVADHSFKDDDQLGEGWCWDDDNPVLTPLLLNRKNNFMELFGKRLKEAGIVLVDSAVAQMPNKILLCSRFHSIDEVLSTMMKNSNNLFAESMFYQIGASGGTRKATAKNAAACIQQLLTRLGQPAETYRIADGSGLSLYNYVTPEMEVRLLRYAWRTPEILGHLLPSLPIAGIDGTLKSRMQGTVAAGNVKAKTGTVTGVSSLAGYLTTENGHELCFSIINQGIMSSALGRNFQDRVCEALCAPSVVPTIKVLPVPRRTVSRAKQTVSRSKRTVSKSRKKTTRRKTRSRRRR